MTTPIKPPIIAILVADSTNTITGGLRSINIYIVKKIPRMEQTVAYR